MHYGQHPARCFDSAHQPGLHHSRESGINATAKYVAGKQGSRGLNSASCATIKEQKSKKPTACKKKRGTASARSSAHGPASRSSAKKTSAFLALRRFLGLALFLRGFLLGLGFFLGRGLLLRRTLFRRAFLRSNFRLRSSRRLLVPVRLFLDDNLLHFLYDFSMREFRAFFPLFLFVTG